MPITFCDVMRYSDWPVKFRILGYYLLLALTTITIILITAVKWVFLYIATHLDASWPDKMRHQTRARLATEMQREELFCPVSDSEDSELSDDDSDDGYDSDDSTASQVCPSHYGQFGVGPDWEVYNDDNDDDTDELPASDRFVWNTAPNGNKSNDDVESTNPEF